MSDSFEPVIGLEIHAQLLTATTLVACFALAGGKCAYKNCHVKE